MSNNKTPRQLAEQRLKIADEYSKLGERLADLKLKRAEWWVENREQYKSDASCERAWDLTEEGKEMEITRMKMKSKEHKMSALRTLLEVAQNEVYNNY